MQFKQMFVTAVCVLFLLKLKWPQKILSKDFSKHRTTKIFVSCCLNFRFENPGVNVYLFIL